MIVHFVSAQQTSAQNAPLLRRIVNIITSKGHTLAHEVSLESLEAMNPQECHTIQAEALARADVVVAEATARSFGVGYQVSRAISMRKPTLVLSKAGQNSSQFARGIEAGVDFHEYTEDSLEDTVTNFLTNHDVSPKDMRFNFFLTRETFNYLRWASVKTGKTKAEILRGLVEKEIERDRASDCKT